MAAHQLVQRTFPFMTERWVAEVMRERDGFGEIFVESQGACDIAGDGCYFHRVRQPGAEMVACAIEKDLGLVFETAKGARMDYPVPVALIVRPPIGRGFLINTAAGVRTELGVRRQLRSLASFEFLARARHA